MEVHPLIEYVAEFEGAVKNRRIVPCMKRNGDHMHCTGYVYESEWFLCRVQATKEIPRNESPLVQVTRIDRSPPAVLVHSFLLLVTKLYIVSLKLSAWYIKKLQEAESFFVS
jgi:hypothetical protein